MAEVTTLRALCMRRFEMPGNVPTRGQLDSEERALLLNVRKRLFIVRATMSSRAGSATDGAGAGWRTATGPRAGQFADAWNTPPISSHLSRSPQIAPLTILPTITDRIVHLPAFARYQTERPS